MKKKIILLLLAAASPFLSIAQGCLTIFSEDGDRFYLVLNGVKQNSVPQTNVRVDGLTNEYYSAKILFEDPKQPEITKNVPVKDVATNDFAEMTYKIKRTKDGQLKLRYFSATPIPVNYVAPPDMYVVHYGQAPVVAGGVTQTTQTTTVTTGAPTGASLNMNAGGVNMNINVSDPTNGGGLNMNVNVGDGGMGVGVNGNVAQTTTTTTTHYSTTTTNDGFTSAPPPPAAGRTGCNYPMDNSSFASAKQTIGRANFEETKLSTAKSILASNCVSTDQVIQICKLFSFEQSKLDFAKFAFGKTTDPANYFKVGNVFSFDASRDELNEFTAH